MHDVTYEGPVTDTHLHLWDRSASAYAWLAHADPALRDTVTIDQVGPALHAAGVTRLILVQADDTVDDTAHLQRTAGAIEVDTSGAGRGIDRVDVVGWLPLRDPRAVRAALDDPERTERLVGVRHLVHDDPDAFFLDRDDVGASLDLLAEAGLPLDVPDAFGRHMEQVVRIAQRHPGLTVVLDHLGKPPLGDPELMTVWRTQLEEIAACSNVVAKVSGLGTSGNGDFSGAADEALALFGPTRLMLGSDWPIAPQHRELSSGFLPLLAHVRSWPDSAVAAVAHRTAERVYRRMTESVLTDGQ